MSQCPSCNSAVVPGSRFCAICHANLVNPSFGTLSSPGKRLGAYFLDVAIPLVAIFIIFAVAGAGAATGSDAGFGVSGLLGTALAIGYVVWALMLFARGTTPGKNLLGMYVMKEDGRRAGFLTMLLREWIGKFISGLIFALGFLWILFDRDNQGWHDKLMSTYVVHKSAQAAVQSSVALPV
jgi:uncharacterized RDD family membrane protein YckC